MAIIKHPNPSVNLDLSALEQLGVTVKPSPRSDGCTYWETLESGAIIVYMPATADQSDVEWAADTIAEKKGNRTILFDGDRLRVIVPIGEEPTRDNVRVVVRHVCEAIGVDFSSQRRNLLKAPWSCVVEMTTQVGVQRRAVLTIPLKALPMWLARLNPGKVRPELRAKIIRYQCEAADALADHFLGRAEPTAITPAAATVSKLESVDWRVIRERRLAARTLVELARLTTGDESRRFREQAARLLVG